MRFWIGSGPTSVPPLVQLGIDSAEREQREELLHAAILHGEHLMNLAARTSQGWSWDTLGVPNERHLLGFAHGGVWHRLCLGGALCRNGKSRLPRRRARSTALRAGAFPPR